MKFWSLQSEKLVANSSTSRKKRNISETRDGGSEAVWKFFKKSSILGNAGVPNIHAFLIFVIFLTPAPFST